MGLRIERNSFARLRPIATLMMVFALVAQPFTGFVSGATASALSNPASALSVTSGCIGEEVVLTASLKGQEAWVFDRKISYITDFGRNDGHSINRWDVDLFTQSTGQIMVSSGVVRAEVKPLLPWKPVAVFEAQYDTINCDTTEPEAPVVSVEPGVHRVSAPVSWNEVRDASGIERYELMYGFNGAAGPTLTVPGDVFSHRGQLLTSYEGEAFVQVRAIDRNSNVSPWSAPISFMVDTAAPVFEVLSLSDGDLVGAPKGHKLQILGTFTDPSGGYVELQLVKNGRDAGLITKHAQVESGLLAEFDVSGFEDGAYQLLARPTDYQGNASPQQTINFTLDQTSPEFSINSPADGATVSGEQRIAAQVGDLNGINKLLMTVAFKTGNKTYVWEDGKANNTLTREGDVYYATVDTQLMEDGVAHVVLRGTDKAGNTRYWNNNSKQRQHGFVVDNTAPIISIYGVERNVDGSYIIAGKGEYGTPVVVGVGGVNSDILPDSEGNWMYKTSVLEDGFYVAVVKSTDIAGNIREMTYDFEVKTPSTPGGLPGFTGSDENGEISTRNKLPLSLPDNARTPVGATFFGYDVSDLVAQANNAPVDTPAVAGVQDNRDTLGATSKAVEATPEGWKIFGMAWYWWLLIVAAVAGAGWWLIGAARRRGEDEPSFLG